MTLMIIHRLLRREEASTVLADELTHFSVLADLVAKSVVLAREALSAPSRAWVPHTRFGLVRFHVHSQGVLANEPAFALRVQAGEAAAIVILLAVLCGPGLFCVP